MAAVPIRISGTVVKVARSVALTPNSRLAITRVSAAAPARPITLPATVSSSPCRSTIIRMRLRSAPSAMRTPDAEQRARAAARDRHLVERSVLAAQIDVLTGRRPVLRDVDARRAQPQHGEPFRVGVGQRLEQQRIDDAEDRR